MKTTAQWAARIDGQMRSVEIVEYERDHGRYVVRVDGNGRKHRVLASDMIGLGVLGRDAAHDRECLEALGMAVGDIARLCGAAS